MPNRLRFVLSALLLVGSRAFAGGTSAPVDVNVGLPSVRLRIHGHTLTAEVAVTAQQQQTGLMHRRSLPPDHGMVFVFAQAQPVCMWMKNTLIPLSVAFIGADGRIVNLADMQPLTEDVHCAQGDVRYALEMPQHWFARHGVKPGDRVRDLPGAAH